jgi:hypothetical protein
LQRKIIQFFRILQIFLWLHIFNFINLKNSLRAPHSPIINITFLNEINNSLNFPFILKKVDFIISSNHFLKSLIKLEYFQFNDILFCSFLQLWIGNHSNCDPFRGKFSKGKSFPCILITRENLQQMFLRFLANFWLNTDFFLWWWKEGIFPLEY